MLWNQVGLVRDEAGLNEARIRLGAWQSSFSEARTPAEHELKNMILVGRLMAAAAIERRESRGGHCRHDFPDADPQWQKHIVVSGSGAAAARHAKEAI